MSLNANAQCQMLIHDADFFSNIDKLFGNPFALHFPRNVKSPMYLCTENSQPHNFINMSTPTTHLQVLDPFHQWCLHDDCHLDAQSFWHNLVESTSCFWDLGLLRDIRFYCVSVQ